MPEVKTKQCKECKKDLAIYRFKTSVQSGWRFAANICVACEPKLKRQCGRCKESKAQKEFGPDPSGRRQVDSFCKVCREESPYKSVKL